MPYNVHPCDEANLDDIEEAEVLGAIHTHEVQGSIHGNEHVQTYMDKAFDIDASWDIYKEFIDNDDVEDNLEFLHELQVEHTVHACPIPNPTLEWFTLNTWDNIHDPSPSMETCLTSW